MMRKIDKRAYLNESTQVKDSDGLFYETLGVLKSSVSFKLEHTISTTGSGIQRRNIRIECNLCQVSKYIPLAQLVENVLVTGAHVVRHDCLPIGKRVMLAFDNTIVQRETDFSVYVSFQTVNWEREEND